MLLLGVLIPVLQTTNGKTNEVRDQVGLRVFLNDVDRPDSGATVAGQQAPPARSRRCRRSSRRSRTCSQVQFVSRTRP